MFQERFMSEHIRMTASFALMSTARMRRLPSIPVLPRLRQAAGITAALLTAMLVMIAGAARAQSHAEFVMVGATPAVVHRPDTGPAPHVAILYENGMSVTHPMCTEMAKRGFMTLCIIESSTGDSWENVALDVKAGVKYLRSQPGITKVVLYGHSGGGGIASFYQAVAENGVVFCQDPKKLSACGDQLAGLPPADGVLFPDAHPGFGVMAVRMVNPSMTTDGLKLHVDPVLDPYDPQNGFNPNGPSHYTPEFQERYFKAQAQVMDQLIAKAQQLQARVRSGEITDPTADQVAILGFGYGTHLDMMDPSIDSLMQTREPRRLLRNDGSIATETIHSVAVAMNVQPAAARRGVSESTSAQFLSRFAARATDSVSDIDFCSANSVTECNTRFIHVPVLFIAAGAGTFIPDEELMYETSPAKDKEYIVVEGALHGGQPCVPCEKMPGQYSNSERNMYDYMTKWINQRF
jgi:pimeloyl-ACP methyl ester carboxylesterase